MTHEIIIERILQQRLKVYQGDNVNTFDMERGDPWLITDGGAGRYYKFYGIGRDSEIFKLELGTAWFIIDSKFYACSLRQINNVNDIILILDFREMDTRVDAITATYMEPIISRFEILDLS